jgi:hypothetical protein
MLVDYQPPKSNIPLFSNALIDAIKPKAKCQFYVGHRKKVQTTCVPLCFSKAFYGKGRSYSRSAKQTRQAMYI